MARRRMTVDDDVEILVTGGQAEGSARSPAVWRARATPRRTASPQPRRWASGARVRRGRRPSGAPRSPRHAMVAPDVPGGAELEALRKQIA